MKKLAAVLLTLTFPLWFVPVFVVCMAWEAGTALYDGILELIS